MRIIVFGAKRCKFCKIQCDYLKNTFRDDDWMYVDVVEDVENLRIASSVNIQDLPTVVILDEGNREIYRKSGTVPPDQISNIINANSIPVTGDKNRVLLSYDPDIEEGSVVRKINMDGTIIKEQSVIKSCKRLTLDSKEITASEKEEYLKRGGRKDTCWIVEFSEERGNGGRNAGQV